VKLAALPSPDPREVHPPETALPRLWRVRSLARFWDCSKPMIFKLVKAGLLKRVKVGTEIRITEESALAYLRQRGRP